MANPDENNSDDPQIIRKLGSFFIRQRIIPYQPDAKEEESQVLPLDVKVEEFLVKIGYSNSQVLGIVLNLMTTGKVRIEFRSGIERLELIHPEDMCSSSEAAELFDSYIKAKIIREKIQVNTEFTGKIIIQARK